jgi:alpha-glucosidase
MCLRGSACLYQGEELGLSEAEIGFADLQDPYGIEFWPEFKGRDGCRTPMPWVTDNASGGFSEGKPWLPVAPSHLARSVAAQAGDEGSILAHYRACLAFRNARAVLRHGQMTLPAARGDLASFTRHDARETIFCAFNLGAGEAETRLPPGDWQALGGEFGATAAAADGTLRLGAWGFALAMKR